MTAETRESSGAPGSTTWLAVSLVAGAVIGLLAAGCEPNAPDTDSELRGAGQSVGRVDV